MKNLKDHSRFCPLKYFYVKKREIMLIAFFCILKLSDLGEVIVIHWLSILALSSCLSDSANTGIGNYFPVEEDIQRE